jgi:hypothetical protein
MRIMRNREARYGAHTYAIRVPKEARAGWELSEEALYFVADSLVVKDGVLMLSVEVDPIEAEEDESTGEIENLPVAVFAPGQWYSAVMVDKYHQPYFAEPKKE